MRKLLVVAGVLIGLFALGYAPISHAESIRIAPLQYQASLKQSEKKKGYVDITNTSSETVHVKLYVEGFSQVDIKGNLTFFPSEQIAKGLLLDYDTAIIGPLQTLRLFFIADGTKLPSGDVFGVIFAETQPATRQSGTTTTARVGTLIMITNGTPGTRHAELSELNVPFLQLGDVMGGLVTVKNPAPKGQATGYFPDMTVEVMPWGGKSEFKGPLILAGNSRTFNFEMPSNQFGLYIVKVKANDAEKIALVFLITGWWKILAPLLVTLIVGGVALAIKYKPSKKLRFKKRSSTRV